MSTTDDEHVCNDPTHDHSGEPLPGLDPSLFMTPEQAARATALSNEMQRHAFSLPEKYNGLEVVRASLAIAVVLCKSHGVSLDTFLNFVDEALLTTTALSALSAAPEQDPA